MNDGKVGTALIQEFRFNQYCKRLQKLIMQKLDDEFKMFMRWRGFNIDSGIFNITLTEPQNFASYRQSELDTARIASFMQVEQLPYMSKRFMMERFLGLSKEEIMENEEMWREEKAEPEDKSATGADLRSVGVTPAGLQSDMETGEEMSGGLEGVEGGEGGADLGGEAPPPVTPPTEV
jgi:hypothetical protein